MTEEKTIKGEGEVWSQDVREFNKARGSRGVKVDGEWHNRVGKISELEKLHELYPKGSFVEFIVKENKRGYWDIEGDIKKIEKKEAYQGGVDMAHPGAEKRVSQPEPSKKTYAPSDIDKNILFQVAFKGAIEIITIPGQSATDLADMALKITEKLYLGLKEKKIQLQEKGEW